VTVPVRFRRTWAGVLALLVMFLPPSTCSSAPLALVESTPGTDASVPAPAQLVLRFDEPIDRSRCSVLLVGGPRNTSVLLLRAEPDNRPDVLVYLLGRLEPGPYKAQWKIRSTGGRELEGVLTFTVVGPGAPR
jgi:methionine-rich copper-binding protein CopC